MPNQPTTDAQLFAGVQRALEILEAEYGSSIPQTVVPGLGRAIVLIQAEENRLLGWTYEATSEDD